MSAASKAVVIACLAKCAASMSSITALPLLQYCFTTTLLLLYYCFTTTDSLLGEMCCEYERQTTCTGDVQEHVQQELRMLPQTLRMLLIRYVCYLICYAHRWRAGACAARSVPYYTYVSSYFYICVLILLHMWPHTGDVQEHVQQEVRMKFAQSLQKIREYEIMLAEAEDWS